jgi:3-hydroxyisobutyrate dehydrogenase-like beta-hydroxyacid dehydrogenase
MAKVGFIGLGWMGLGMCKCLIRAGHEITIYDVMNAPMDELVAYSANYKGTVSKASSVKKVGENSEYVSVVVRDEPQYRNVLTGPDGLIQNMNKDAMIVIHGTLSPQFVREMAILGLENGVIIIDGPITGQKREEGQITVMVGSSDTDFKRIEPILKPMGRILHTGDIGSGEVTKLVNNIMGSLNMLVTTEALMFGVKAGVPIETLLDQASNPESGGHSFAVTHWDGLVKMKKIFRETGSGPAALTYKDLAIALQSAREFGLELPLTALGANSDVGKLPEDYL